MGSSTALTLITTTAGDLGVSVLAVFGLVLGIAVGVFVIKFAWKKLKGSAH